MKKFTPRKKLQVFRFEKDGGACHVIVMHRTEKFGKRVAAEVQTEEMKIRSPGSA